MILNSQNVLCCTGHRPIGFPWQYKNDPVKDKTYLDMLWDTIENYIMHRSVKAFITGMALGADMDFAETVLALRKVHRHISLHCAIPCRNQTEFWSSSDINRYKDIIENANTSVCLSEKYFSGCMHIRNRYMVCHSNFILAIWNGEKQGGTWYTMQYARKLNKEMDVLRLDKIL